MEKISHIVRGNSRVASVDLKNSSAVRPGVPTYGRPVGESSVGAEIAGAGTTAGRAVALHAQINESRRSGPDRVAEAIAEQFFMTRLRGPELEGAPTESVGSQGAGTAESSQEIISPEASAPSGYTPRGTFVDVTV